VQHFHSPVVFNSFDSTLADYYIIYVGYASGVGAKFLLFCSEDYTALTKLKPIEVLMALAVPLVWGMGFVFAKGAIGHFPPILLMALRFSLTALILVWFVPVPREHLRSLFGIAIIAAAIQYSLTFTGLKGLDAGIAALIVQLEVPFLVILGIVFLKEKAGVKTFVGIATAFIGVAIMSQQDELRVNIGSVLLVVSGAFFWAIGQVMIRNLRNIKGMQVTAWIAVFAVPQLFIMSAIFEDGQLEAIQEATPVVWWAVVYLGVVMTAFGYFLWNTLIRNHDVGDVAPYLLLLPLFSLIGGIVFLGESPSLPMLIGGLVILFGVGLITIPASVFKLSNKSRN
jgi:O-acetylserine/cysteine efflux transporter